MTRPVLLTHPRAAVPTLALAAVLPLALAAACGAPPTPRPPAADDFLVSRFERADVVMLSEDHRIRQNLEFVHALIPKLHAAGVHTLVMEFGAEEDQARLDSLLSAPEYDEAVARDLLFAYNVGWAWKEYMDVYRAAWAFNRTLPEDARPFRVLNMSYRYDWSEYDGSVARTPEIDAKIFPRGAPDVFRAGLVARAILDRPGEKAVVLTGTVHAFTRFRPSWPAGDGTCVTGDAGLGNLLHERYPGRVLAVALHHPMPAADGTPSQPAGGALESLAEEQGFGVGIDLVGTPEGSLPVVADAGPCREGTTMGDVYDGYLVLAPFDRLDGCTIDDAFLTDADWPTAYLQYPDPNWHGGRPASLDELRARIRAYADVRAAYSPAFRTRNGS